VPVRQFVFAILFGCALIAFGLVPGLFQSLQDGIRNFSASISSPFPMTAPHRRDYDKLSRPLWLAVIGVALILASLFMYRS
jgi:hypothetical protein